MKKFIALAEVLFTLETESMGNNLDINWEFNGWLDKYGEASKKFEPQLITKDKDVLELAKILKADFDNGLIKTNEDGDLYNYEMPELYGGFIINKLEEQLANLTGVGTQLEIFA